MYRRHTPQAEPGEGAAIVLVLIILILPIYLAYQLLRYRPQPYRPLTPESAQELTRTDWGGLLFFMGVGLTMIIAGLTDLANRQFTVNSQLLLVGGLSCAGFGAGVFIWQQLTPTPKPVNTPPHPQQARTYTLYPARHEADYSLPTTFISTLLSVAPRLTFQIVGTPTGIFWQVVDPKGQYPPQVITDHIRSHYPAAVVSSTPALPDASTRLPLYRQHVFFRLANEYAAPLLFGEQLKAHDPLMTITQRMDFLRAENGEQIVYQVAAQVRSEPARRRAAERVKAGNIGPLPGLLPTDDQQSRLDERLLAAKLAGPLYHCFVVVTVESKRPERLSELAQVALDMAQYRQPGHNQMSVAWTSRVYALGRAADAQATTFEALLAASLTQQETSWRADLLILHPKELAALWHVPDETFTAQGIAWVGPAVPRELTAPTLSPQHVLLGTASTPGQPTPIFLAPPDRAYHHYLMGKAGMGKSTLIHNLVQQDIAAGQGVAVLDPHGKLIADILATSIPSWRAADVILLECGNTRVPIPLNPFRVPQGLSYSRAFDYVLWSLQKIYERIWREGQTELVLRHVVAALLCDPDATPLDMARLFTSDTYRQHLIHQIEAHEEAGLAVAQFWREEFGQLSPGERQRLAAPIRNRTGAFLGSRHLERMTCHPATLNFAQLIQERAIILIDLSGETIRSEVGSLGALFLASLFMASEALGYITQPEPRLYLYVDEVERIMTSPLPDMLAQCRKFGLSLTLANQYLNQLSSETLHGILGNVGSHFVFEVGEKDARTLAPYFAPEVEVQQLINLGAYRMAVKTRAQGKTLPAFVVNTPPAPHPRDGYMQAEAVRALFARNQNLLTAQAVSEWIQARYQIPPATNSAAVTPAPPDSTTLSDYE